MFLYLKERLELQTSKAALHYIFPSRKKKFKKIRGSSARFELLSLNNGHMRPAAAKKSRRDSICCAPHLLQVCAAVCRVQKPQIAFPNYSNYANERRVMIFDPADGAAALLSAPLALSIPIPSFFFNQHPLICLNRKLGARPRVAKRDMRVAALTC